MQSADGSSSRLVTDDDDEDSFGTARDTEEQQKSSWRTPAAFACGVALIIFLVGSVGNRAMQNHVSHALPSQRAGAVPDTFAPVAQPVYRSEKRTATIGIPPPQVRKSKRMSEREREEKRLNDVKTQEIREAQEDPTSMFDMSNA